MRLPSFLPLGGGVVEAIPVEDCPPAPELVSRLCALLDVFPVRDYWRRVGRRGELDTALDHAREYVATTTGRKLPRRRRSHSVNENV